MNKTNYVVRIELFFGRTSWQLCYLLAVINRTPYTKDTNLLIFFITLSCLLSQELRVVSTTFIPNFINIVPAVWAWWNNRHTKTHALLQTFAVILLAWLD